MVFLTNVIKIYYFALSAGNSFFYIEFKTKKKQILKRNFYSILFYFQWENNNNNDENNKNERNESNFEFSLV